MTADILTDINRIHFIPRMLIITQTLMSPSKGAIVWHENSEIFVNLRSSSGQSMRERSDC